MDWPVFLSQVFEDLATARVILGADRYRKSELLDALARADVAPVSMEWRGTGAGATADGSHDIRAFQRAVAERQLREGEKEGKGRGGDYK